MADVLQPWQVLLAVLAGWVDRHQQAGIDYLGEENRILHEHVGKRRLRLSDAQRRRLAVAGKALGRKALKDVVMSPPGSRDWTPNGGDPRLGRPLPGQDLHPLERRTLARHTWRGSPMAYFTRRR